MPLAGAQNFDGRGTKFCAPTAISLAGAQNFVPLLFPHFFYSIAF
jgi:hypothetical protein